MTTQIDLKPSPGFCIKSSALQSAVYSPALQLPPPPNQLEPTLNGPIVVTKGMKVFVNIAWDNNVPKPPPGSEDAIQRAMQGEDLDEHNPDGWYVPVVVSEPRIDKDKAGNPSLVIDCVYNASIKSRTLRDPEFKIFLVELALQRIEAQTQILLSRQIGTPNIAAKGKLKARRVLVPTALLTGEGQGTDKSKTKKAPLIQEVNEGEVRGILKKGGKGKEGQGGIGRKLDWTWRKREDGRLEVRVQVPGLTHALINETTLDLESRRFILAIPGHPVLDINIGLSDAEIVATSGAGTSADGHVVGTGEQEEPDRTLKLKRQRDLDVEGAKAEWRVGEGVLVVDC